MELTDEQWAVLALLIPQAPRREDGKGRPRRAHREVLEGILWVLRTGAQWADLPGKYPPYQTCHRRFQEWVGDGVLKSVLEALAQNLAARGELDLSECFIDGTFVAAKKGGSDVGTTKRGKGSKVMAVADAAGTCLALHLASASPHEVRLAHETLAAGHVKSKPEKLIGDKAYDSDPLDAELAEQGVELIAPHRSNRTKPKTQDGRKLRRYKRRWKIERLFAHLGNFRRLVVRYERFADNFLGFLQLGCIKLLLKRF